MKSALNSSPMEGCATRISAAMQGGDEMTHALARLNEIGGPDSLPLGPVGWASTLNTPFPYYRLPHVSAACAASSST